MLRMTVSARSGRQFRHAQDDGPLSFWDDGPLSFWDDGPLSF